MASDQAMDGTDRFRKQDPVITGAVRTALVDGRGEGIAVLDGERLPVEPNGPDLVAATDEGDA